MAAMAAFSLTSSTLQLDAQLIEDLIELLHCWQPSLKVISAAVKEATKTLVIPLNVCRLTILVQAVTEIKERNVINLYYFCSPTSLHLDRHSLDHCFTADEESWMSFRVVVIDNIFILNFNGGQRLVVLRESLTQHTTRLYRVGEDILAAILSR